MWILPILCLALTVALVGLSAYCLAARRKNAALRADARALQLSQKRLEDFALGQLLRGNAPEFERIEDFYRIYHLEFDSEAFMLLVVKLRHHHFGTDAAGQANAYAAVRDELSSILGLTVQTHFVEMDGVLVCFYSEPRVTIHPPSANQTSLRALLAQQCEACAASLMDNQQIRVIIALGQYDLGGFALHTNFISTKVLLEQAASSRWEGTVLLDAGELSQKTDMEFTNTQRQFYNCFICFKYRDAARHLFHMVQLRCTNYYDSFEEAREIVAHHLTFCTNMLELPLNFEFTLPESGSLGIRELMCSADEAALQRNLLRYFSGMELHVTGMGTKAAPATKRVHDYIDTHFDDPEISVTGLSEKFRLNVSYLSRQFKQEYGYGVLECIHKARGARAKTLIADGMPLNQVWVRVGYTSRRAFDSAFSRYEGITPKAYQSQLAPKPGPAQGIGA